MLAAQRCGTIMTSACKPSQRIQRRNIHPQNPPTSGNTRIHSKEKPRTRVALTAPSAMVGRTRRKARWGAISPPRWPRWRRSSRSSDNVRSRLEIEEEANGRSIAVVVGVDVALEAEVPAPVVADPLAPRAGVIVDGEIESGELRRPVAKEGVAFASQLGPDRDVVLLVVSLGDGEIAGRRGDAAGIGVSEGDAVLHDERPIGEVVRAAGLDTVGLGGEAVDRLSLVETDAPEEHELLARQG